MPNGLSDKPTIVEDVLKNVLFWKDYLLNFPSQKVYIHYVWVRQFCLYQIFFFDLVVKNLGLKFYLDIAFAEFNVIG